LAGCPDCIGENMKISQMCGVSLEQVHSESTIGFLYPKTKAP
jgi:hypothetical protein